MLRQVLIYLEELHKEWSQHAYENDEYKVVIPKSVQEFLDESQQQDNCLFSMVDEILRGECIVLFMRRKMELGKSLVTFEIRGNSIVQAKRRFNRAIEPKDREFLLEFAKVKKIHPGCLDDSNYRMQRPGDIEGFEAIIREFQRLGNADFENFMRIPEPVTVDGLPFA